MENTTVGEYIRQLRKRTFWTVRGLAKRAGMSPAYISQIENGKRPLTPKAAVRIADAFRMQPYELMTAAGFIPAEHLAKAEEMATLAMADHPDIVKAAHGSGDLERYHWLVVDYLYLYGHDVYAQGWDSGPGHHADWRLIDPSLPAPYPERIKPEMDAWMAEQRERDTITKQEWSALTPAQRSIIRELIDNFLASPDGPGSDR